MSTSPVQVLAKDFMVGLGILPYVFSPYEKRKGPSPLAFKVVADEGKIYLFQPLSLSLSTLTNTSLPLCEQCWPMSMLKGGACTFFFIQVTAGIGTPMKPKTKTSTY